MTYQEIIIKASLKRRFPELSFSVTADLDPKTNPAYVAYVGKNQVAHNVEVHIDSAITTAQSANVIDTISIALDRWVRATRNEDVPF